MSDNKMRMGEMGEGVRYDLLVESVALMRESLTRMAEENDRLRKEMEWRSVHDRLALYGATEGRTGARSMSREHLSMMDRIEKISLHTNRGKWMSYERSVRRLIGMLERAGGFDEDQKVWVIENTLEDRVLKMYDAEARTMGEWEKVLEWVKERCVDVGDQRKAFEEMIRGWQGENESVDAWYQRMEGWKERMGTLANEDVLKEKFLMGLRRSLKTLTLNVIDMRKKTRDEPLPEILTILEIARIQELAEVRPKNQSQHVNQSNRNTYHRKTPTAPMEASAVAAIAPITGRSLASRILQENPGVDGADHEFALHRVPRLQRTDPTLTTFIAQHNMCSSCRVKGKRQEHRPCPYFTPPQVNPKRPPILSGINNVPRLTPEGNVKDTEIDRRKGGGILEKEGGIESNVCTKDEEPVPTRVQSYHSSICVRPGGDVQGRVGAVTRAKEEGKNGGKNVKEEGVSGEDKGDKEDEGKGGIEGKVKESEKSQNTKSLDESQRTKSRDAIDEGHDMITRHAPQTKEDVERVKKNDTTAPIGSITDECIGGSKRPGEMDRETEEDDELDEWDEWDEWVDDDSAITREGDATITHTGIKDQSIKDHEKKKEEVAESSDSDIVVNKKYIQLLLQRLRWGTFDWHLFAVPSNTVAPKYFVRDGERSKGEGCMGNDAMSHSWTHLQGAYVNPPSHMIHKAVKKIKEDKVDVCVLIAPLRSRSRSQLEEMSVTDPILIPRTEDVFLDGRSDNLGDVAAYVVTGRRKKKNEKKRYDQYVDVLGRNKTEIEGEGEEESLKDVIVDEERWRFEAELDGHRVTILKDSGSAMNVIGEPCAVKLGLRRQKMPTIKLKMADGERIFSSNEMVEGTLKKGSYRIKIRLAVIPTDEDVILGTPWESLMSKETFNSTIGKYEFVTRRGKKHTWYKKDVEHKRVAVIDKEEMGELWRRGASITAIMVERKDEKITTITTEETDVEKTIGGLPTELQDIIRKRRMVFNQPTGLPPKRPEDLEIKTDANARIPSRPLNHLSSDELKVLQEKLDELLKKGWIVPSKSPYGTVVLFAKKKDGSLRMCVDFRALNKITEKDVTPVVSLDQLRESIKDAKYLTKIDIRDAYHMIRMKEEDQHKTAFKTRFGLYEFTVMPFGLTNAPACFTRMMNRIFSDMHHRSVIIYIDDIIIFSKTKEEHKEHVAEVLKRLEENGLYAKLSKCTFAAQEVEFGGFKLSTEGISIQEESVEAITNYEMPLKTRQDVQAFLGLMNFFMVYIPNFAEIAEPLSNLTSTKMRWSWTEREMMAVRTLQHLVVTAPTLALYDQIKETRVWTDASNVAIGGFVEQRQEGDLWKPCFFYSKKLDTAERNYPIHDRELLALVSMLRKYEPHLKSTPFTAFVDHNPLVYLNTQPKLNPRQVRWVEFLQQFPMKLEYVEGGSTKEIRLADALSRLPMYYEKCPFCPHCHKKEKGEDNDCTDCEVKIAAIKVELETGSKWKEEVKKELKKDELAGIVRGETLKKDAKGISKKDRKRLKEKEDGLIYYEDRLYVPEKLRLGILRSVHDKKAFNHGGNHKTCEAVRTRFWWPRWRDEVKEYVKSCDICQRSKHANTKETGLLHPLPIPEERFQDIAMDFAAMPKDKEGEDMVLIIVDRLTKLTRAIPMFKTANVEDVAKRFVNDWILTGKGLPKSIVSDRDTKFTSKMWTAMCKELEIDQRMATARHQQTDGLAEVTVRIVKEALARTVNYHKNNWKELLPSIENAMNSSISSTTGYAPYYLAYGLSPRIDTLPTPNTALANLAEIEKEIEKAKENIIIRQEGQKRTYDKNHDVAPKLKVNDEVLLKREGLVWSPEVQRPPQLSLPYIGPFKVKAVLENDNIELKLPPTLPVHPIFHVSRVKRYIDPATFHKSRKRTTKQPPELDEDGNEVFEIEKLLDVRISKGRREWLIRWKGYGEEDDMWIPEHGMAAKDLMKEFKEKNGRHPAFTERVRR